MVRECKNKNGRYENLIQIIGSLSTFKPAYLTIKRNKRISAKEKTTQRWWYRPKSFIKDISRYGQWKI